MFPKRFFSRLALAAALVSPAVSISDAQPTAATPPMVGSGVVSSWPSPSGVHWTPSPLPFETTEQERGAKRFASEQPAGRGEVASPTLFVQNDGQWDARVRFQMRQSNETWWFTEEGVWLTVVSGSVNGYEADKRMVPGRDYYPLIRYPSVDPSSGVHLKLTFPGLSPAARLVPENLQPTHLNYFRGSDPARWRSNVPTFSKLRWENVVPGLDVEFGPTWHVLSTDNLLRQDTRPAAESPTGERGESPISNLHIQVEGADDLSFDTEGRLVANTSLGPVVLPGLLTRDITFWHPSVAGHVISFSSDSSPTEPKSKNLPWDNRREENPSSSDLLYSTFLGGSFTESGYGIAIGEDGAAYVTGITYSTDFPTTPGTFDTTYNGGVGICCDAFVTKIAPNGSNLVYSTYLGGSSSDWGADIAVDNAGNASLFGYTVSSDFPVTPGAFDTRFGGESETFVARLNPAGSAMLYSTFLGGNNPDQPEAISVTPDGAAVVSGYTYSRDFPTTPGAFATSCVINQTGFCSGDIFVTEINSTGTGLVYSTLLGGMGEDFGYDLARAADGTTYITGMTRSPDFPITPGAFDTTCDTSPCGSAFVTRLDATGSVVLYSSFLGGATSEETYGESIAVGADGAAYVTGYTFARDFPTTPGAYDMIYQGGDVFITRFSPDGRSLDYSTFLGGAGNDYSYSLAIAADGSAIISGNTCSGNFPTTPGAFDTTANGNACGTGTRGDFFVTQVSTGGDTLIYSTYFGQHYADCGRCAKLALGPDDTVYLTGGTDAPGFPITTGAFQTSLGGISDAFLAKLWLDPSGATLRVGKISPGYVPMGDHYQVGVGITVQDSSGKPISGAIVEGTMGYPDGHTVPLRGTTGARSIVSHAETTSLTGIYTFTVSTVSKDGWGYDPALNLETTDSIQIPTLLVAAMEPFYQPGRGWVTMGATITIQDFVLRPVLEARITVQAALPDGSLIDLAATTDARGRATVSLTTSQLGTFVFTVTDVSKPGWGYDPEYNRETSASLSNQILYMASIEPGYQVSGDGYIIDVTLLVQDVTGAPVRDASILGYVDFPNDRRYWLRGSTDADGQAYASTYSRLSGTYTFTVYNVSKAGWTYDPAQNVETSDSVTIP